MAQGSYCLGKNERLPEGLKRIAVAQIDKAIDALSSFGDDDDRAIHDARVCSKKVRAILRLVRSEIGGKVFKRENACFRDAARRLSIVRDTAAAIESLDELRAKYPGGCDRATVEEIRRRLVRARGEGRPTKRAAMTEVSAVLLEARERVAEWPIRREDFSAIERGLEATHARGRAGYEKAFRKPGTANFHQWRKEAQRFLYQLKILRAAWPKMVEVLADETGRLTDNLSDDHDLANLRAASSRLPSPLAGSTLDLESLLGTIAHARMEARSRARLLGERIYAEESWALVGQFGPIGSHSPNTWSSPAPSGPIPADLNRLDLLSRCPHGALFWPAHLSILVAPRGVSRTHLGRWKTRGPEPLF